MMLGILTAALVHAPLARAAAPNPPTSLVQTRSDLTTAIPASGFTNEMTIVLWGTVSDPDAGSTLTPWIEITDTSRSFTGACGTAQTTGLRRVLAGSSVTASSGGVGVLSSVAVSWGQGTNLFVSGTALKWRMCVIDQTGASSGWITYGTIPAVTLDRVTPSTGLIWTPVSGAQGRVGTTDNWAFGGAGSATLTATATDDLSGVQRVDFAAKPDGYTPAAAFSDASAPFEDSFSWLETAGPYSSSVTVVDRAGNSATFSGPSLAKDTTGPQLQYTMSAGSSSGWQSSASSISFGGGVASDSSGIATQQVTRYVAPLVEGVCGTFSVDRTWPTLDAIDSTLSTDYETSYPDFYGGLTHVADLRVDDSGGLVDNACYQYGWAATDVLGNTSSAGRCDSVKIDTIPPDGALVDFPDFSWLTASRNVQIMASDNQQLSSVRFSVDGATAASFTQSGTSASGIIWTLDTSSMSEGQHVLSMTTTDRAGNLDNDSRTFIVDRTAPSSAAITQPGLGSVVSGIVNVDVTAMDNVGVHMLRYAVDGHVFATRSAPTFTALPTVNDTAHLDTTSLTDGLHNLTVTALDAPETSSPRSLVSQSHTIMVDNTAPAILIGSLTDGSVLSDTTPTAFTVAATDSLAGLAQVQFLVDGSIRETQAATGLTWTGSFIFDPLGLTSGAHTIGIKSTDTLGHTRNVVRSVTIDSVAPLVSITQPVTGATLTSVEQLTVQATDDANVTKLEWMVNGMIIASKVAPIDFASAPVVTQSASWNTSVIANGNYSLTVRAFDQYGHTAISTPVEVSVDNNVATAGITSHIDGEFVDGDAPVIIAARGSTPMGVTSMRLYVDGLEAAIASFSYANPALPSFTWDASSAAPGSHTAYVRTEGTVAGSVNSPPITLIVDQDAPSSVTISRPTTGSWVSNTMTVDIDALDDTGISSLAVRIDGQVVGTKSAPVDFVRSPSVSESLLIDTSLLSDGSHTVDVVARDRFAKASTSMSAVINVDNIDPAVTLESPLSGATIDGVNSVNVVSNASDIGGITKVELLVDSAVRDSVIFPATTSQSHTLVWNPLVDQIGLHSLRVRYTDRAGNTTLSQPTSVSIDRDGPSTVAITSPAPGATGLSAVNIAASATDDVAITRLEWYIDGVQIAVQQSPSDFTAAASVTRSATWNSAATSDGTHDLIVIARDALGRAATTNVVTISIDNSPPSPVLVTSPAAGTRVAGSVQLQGSATKTGSTIASMQWIIDGQTAATYTAPSHFPVGVTAVHTFTWDTVAAAVPDGTHTVAIRASDIDGRTSVSAERQLILDNTGPSAVDVISPTLTRPLRGRTVVTAGATDAAGIAQLELFVDGARVATGSATNGDLLGATNATWQATIATENLSQTMNHYARVRATDTLGNISVSPLRMFVVDNTSPASSSIVAPVAGQVVGSNITVSAQGVDNRLVRSFEFLLNGVVVANPQAPNDFTAGSTATASVTLNAETLANGSYQLAVRTIDDAGNVTLSQPVSVMVDNSRPEVIVTKPPPSVITSSEPLVVHATASDANGINRAAMLVDGIEVAINTFDTETPTTQQLTWSNVNSVSSGLHQIRVSFTDTAGNRALSGTYSVKVDKGTPTRSELISHQVGDTVSGFVNFVVRSSDDLGFQTVQLIVDNATPAIRRTFSRTITSTNNDIFTTFAIDTISLNIPDGQHTITTISRDLAGRESSSTIAVMVKNDFVAPANVSMIAPTAFYVLTPGIPFAWRASDNKEVASYDTRIRFGTSVLGDTTSWLNQAESTSATYSNTIRGGTYCASVRAYDVSGNVSEWTNQRCAAIPLDDRDLVRAGLWTRATPASAYAATTSTSKNIGASLATNTITTRTLALVTTRCTGCGTVAVFWNNRFIKSVNLAAATTQSRSVTPITSFTTPQTGKLSIRVLLPGTNGATIDGVITSIA